MKAVWNANYGPLDALEVCEIERPTVSSRQVLIQVRAASVDIGNCFAVRGAPLPMRLETGLRRPRWGVPGCDVAGTVVEVGSDVTAFRSGDEVFGLGEGSCAEFARADEGTLAIRPAGLSTEQAAALPSSGVAALHALRDVAALKPGQRVLVIGASGGVGSFAVQIAKAMGAEVTGVCSGANVDLVRGLGADHVIDYQRADFAADGPRYDVIFDNVEARSLADCRRALMPRGLLVLNSGTGARGLRLMVRLLTPLLLTPFTRQRMRRYISRPATADLAAMAELVTSEAVTAVVERTYPLADTVEALRHLETGRARGKLVIVT